MLVLNARMGLDEFKGTELDWLLRSSKNIILFRDELQRIRKCDIDEERFNSILNEYNKDSSIIRLFLDTQWRCNGGVEYTSYVYNILNCTQNKPIDIQNYDLRLYDDVDDMVNSIKKLEGEYGLCRVVAGYDWKWISQKKGFENYCDIKIGKYEYQWNKKCPNWLMSDNAINEIGCIHTVQGFDLNYVGLIIGPDLKFDKNKGRIISDMKEYKDPLGKAGFKDDPEGLLSHLKNIYLTLMTRGIRGTYVYACDEALREYLKKFIATVK